MKKRNDGATYFKSMMELENCLSDLQKVGIPSVDDQIDRLAEVSKPLAIPWQDRVSFAGHVMIEMANLLRGVTKELEALKEVIGGIGKGVKGIGNLAESLSQIIT